MAIPTRAELDALIQEKLANDPAFRDALLTDPRAAVSDILGVDLPEFVSMTVHEESLTDVHLVIPALVREEIPDDDLELVAGGNCWANAGSCADQCI